MSGLDKKFIATTEFQNEDPDSDVEEAEVMENAGGRTRHRFVIISSEWTSKNELKL